MTTNDAFLNVDGVRLGVAQAGIRKPNRKDMLVMSFCQGTAVAGVFTQNRFCAAPVQIAQRHLQLSPDVRALVVNTGCANAGTGEQGLKDAQQTCMDLAALLHVPIESVLPFSTGVIMEHLPMDRLRAGLKQAVAGLGGATWNDAAEAIMTTDTRPKFAHEIVVVRSESIGRVVGIAKGAGMIHPNMATMLGYVVTDLGIGSGLLQAWTKEIADQSFNCISVDGDTSTNDSFIIAATGAANQPVIDDSSDPRANAVFQALLNVAQQLAQAIVRDGEGATKFITVRVEQANSVAEAKMVANAIARSPLVKTAFFASDPNLGRILAAIGYAGIDALDVQNIRLYLDDVLVAERGGRAENYREQDGQAVMKQTDITVTVQLGRGHQTATVWTCDLSQAYVAINADYRS